MSSFDPSTSLSKTDLHLLNTHPNAFALKPHQFPLDPENQDIENQYPETQYLQTQCPETSQHPQTQYLKTQHLDLEWRDLIKTADLGARPPVKVDESSITLPSEQGMSPKKRHEVSVMTAYIVSLVQKLPQGAFIVDVGAGQGYLTRSLKHNLPKSHILALDADSAQSEGAKKWEGRVLRLGPLDPVIEHKTILINTHNLLAIVDEWVGEKQGGMEHGGEGGTEGGREGTGERAGVPVVLIGLHACGSLTPDILRTYLASTRSRISMRDAESVSSLWYPAAVVAVGCCYNLMRPGDFPLSKRFNSYPHIPTAAYHLAAQVPSTWVDSDASRTPRASFQLSMRKVVWRALLGRILEYASVILVEEGEGKGEGEKKGRSATVPARWSRRPETWDVSASVSAMAEKSTSTTTTTATTTAPAATVDEDPSTGQNNHNMRLGRLSDAVFKSWSLFVDAASKKLGVVFPPYVYELPIGKESDVGNGLDVAGCSVNTETQRDGLDVQRNELDVDFRELEKQLEVLHVKRCLLGPRVEESILDDRVEWFREKLEDIYGADGLVDHKVEVERVNLFDQLLGSARNVAVVVAPAGCIPRWPQ